MTRTEVPFLATSVNEVVEVDGSTEDLFFVGHGAMYPAIFGGATRPSI